MSGVTAIFTGVIGSVLFGGVIVVIGILILTAKFYQKVEQGWALVRNGWRGTKVAFTGIIVIPILHRAEPIDISVKRVSIDRAGSEGLICKDNMRADIKVAFFVRVNNTTEDVLRVAQSIGCKRASSREALQELFEAKFSEGLKTVGKQFEFTQLYTSREQFKEEILKVIGTDLNGFILDDAAIDFLEQTNIQDLSPDNILDAEGIKKITRITAQEIILANKIERDKEKVITQQDVEAKEAILELNRQLADAENKQKREIASIKAREEAETAKIQEEERLKAETARIATEEEIAVSEENKDRQIIVAKKNKERTEAIETERVEKDRMIEATERERIVALAQIEKEKAIEVEKKNIQNIIRERVKVERTVVEEEEIIKDTKAFKEADRDKRVAVTKAEKEAEESLVIEVKAAEASRKAAAMKAEEEMLKTVKAAEASKQAAELNAGEIVIKAEARLSASEKEAEAKKKLAEGIQAEKAAPGLADVEVHRAENSLIEPQGTAEAKVIQIKFLAEAKGIESKANAMKLLDTMGREHEEFKLRLQKEKDIELAEIEAQQRIAANQAEVLGNALKNAKVDIVGGETEFFDRIVNAVTGGKSVDRFIENSKTLSDMKETFFNADPDYFKTQLKTFFSRFDLSPEDLKNLTISAALSSLVSKTKDESIRGDLYELISLAERCGLKDRNIASFLGSQKKKE